MYHQSNHSCTWATVTTCREIWSPAEMAQISQWHTWLRWLIYYKLVHFPPIWRGPLCLPNVWSLEFCWLPVCLSIHHSPPGLSFVFNPIMPCVEISWPQQEVTRPAVSGTHLLISQPPHWPTQQDGCFAHMSSPIPTFIWQTVLFSLQFPGCSFYSIPDSISLFLCFRLVVLTFCLLRHLWIPAPGSHFCSYLLSLSSCSFFYSRNNLSSAQNIPKCGWDTIMEHKTLCDSVVLVSVVQLISRRILIIVSRRGPCGVKSSLFITGRHIP